MSFAFTHYTNIDGPQNLFNTISSFITSTLGWTVLKSGTIGGSYGKDYKIFYSTGESGQEDIYVGICWYYYNNQRVGFQLNGYTGYNDSMDFDNLGNISTTKESNIYSFLPTFLLQDVNYDHVWLLGDKDVIVGVIRNVSIWPCFYLGFLRRYWSRQFDPYPLYLFATFSRLDLGNSTDSNPQYYDWNTSSFTGFAANNLRDWLWYAYDSWTHSFHYDAWDRGDSTTLKYGIKYIDTNLRTTSYPFLHTVDGLPTGKYMIAPFIVSDGGTGVRGEMKWVYKLSRAVDLDPEDEITIGSSTYKVFPSTFDLNVSKYYAIRMS